MPVRVGEQGLDGVTQDRLVAFHGAVSIGHGDAMLRNQLVEDLDRLLPA